MHLTCHPDANILLELEATQSGFIISSDLAHIQLPRLYTNKVDKLGTAIKTDGAGFGKLICNTINFFDIGVHVVSNRWHCLDPMIEINISFRNNTAVKIDATTYGIEGVHLKFNFIAESQKAIETQSSDWANIPVRYCTFEGVAIDSHLDGGGGYCLYGRLYNSVVRVTGFFGAPNGISVGGDLTILGVTKNFYALNCTFELAYSPVGIDFEYGRFAGANTKIINLTTPQQGTPTIPGEVYNLLETRPTTRTLSNVTAANIVLVKVTLPAGVAGTSIQRLMYSAFLLNGWNKFVKITPIGVHNDFVVDIQDYSHVNYNEMVVTITYTSNVTVEREAMFYVEIP
ncbi:hypothetical protein D3C74_253820 [compost metagenome]